MAFTAMSSSKGTAFVWSSGAQYSDSEIVMVDRTFWDDSFEQDRSWDDYGTTISGIGAPKFMRVRMQVLIVVP